MSATVRKNCGACRGGNLHCSQPGLAARAVQEVSCTGASRDALRHPRGTPPRSRPQPPSPPTFAKVSDWTSMWSAPHSGHLSEIMTITDRGLPAESVLHTPAGGVGWGGAGGAGSAAWSVLLINRRFPEQLAAPSLHIAALFTATLALTGAVIGALDLEALAAALQLVGGVKLVGGGQRCGGEVGILVFGDSAVATAPLLGAKAGAAGSRGNRGEQLKFRVRSKLEYSARSWPPCARFPAHTQGRQAGGARQYGGPLSALLVNSETDLEGSIPAADRVRGEQRGDGKRDYCATCVLAQGSAAVRRRHNGGRPGASRAHCPTPCSPSWAPP